MKSSSDAARASGNARSKASDLAEQASRAYAVGNGDEARVLARAAVELGENTYAVEIVKNVDLDRTLADPEKARALRSLNDVDVVLAAFDRDINAATSKAMQDGATLARALGDTFTAQRLMTEASSFGREAKGAAFIIRPR